MKKVLLILFAPVWLLLLSCEKSDSDEQIEQQLIGHWTAHHAELHEIVVGNPEVATIIEDATSTYPYGIVSAETEEKSYLFDPNNKISLTSEGDSTVCGRYLVSGERLLMIISQEDRRNVEFSVSESFFTVLHDETAAWKKFYPDAGIEKVLVNYVYTRHEPAPAGADTIALEKDIAM